MADWYNPRKASQIAAYFAQREGGKINVLKLVKLIYLADRNFMKAFDSSMINDNLVSMDHGPVNSRTLNFINGLAEDSGWSEFITDRENHFIGLASSEFADSDLDELSRAEIGILEKTWSEFGGMTRWQIRDYTHDHCPEWEDPDGSSNPIPYERVFKALGKSKPSELDERIRTDRWISSVLRD